MLPLIDSEALNAIFLDCLYKPEEITITDSKPEDAVIVEGVLHKFGLHPQRLENHRTQVAAWLLALPEAFQKTKGGGWSFLNACNDRNEEQWTDLHQRMDQLFALGLGLGFVSYAMPREMWDVLPGGMPYLIVKDDAIAKAKSATGDQR